MLVAPCAEIPMLSKKVHGCQKSKQLSVPCTREFAVHSNLLTQIRSPDPRSCRSPADLAAALEGASAACRASSPPNQLHLLHCCYCCSSPQHPHRCYCHSHCPLAPLNGSSCIAFPTGTSPLERRGTLLHAPSPARPSFLRNARIALHHETSCKPQP